MNYPHWGVVSRVTVAPTPGGYTDDDGVWHDDPVQPDTAVIYEGPGDFQDKGEAIETDSAGQPTLIADGVFYPKNERIVADIEPLDRLEVTYKDGTKESGEVLRVRRLDGAVFIRRMA